MITPKDFKIYVAGHSGLEGSNTVRRLESGCHANLVVCTQQKLDLLDQASVNTFFESEKPEYVFLAAAKVVGIHTNNTCPAQFLYQNLMMQPTSLTRHLKMAFNSPSSLAPAGFTPSSPRGGAMATKFP